MSKILDEFEFSYLRKLQSFGYNAVIAGGSIRDMVKKVPYKDVDFFVFYQAKFNLGRFFDEEVQEIFNTDFEIKNPGMFDASFNPKTSTIAIGNGDISGHRFQLVVVNTTLNPMIKSQFDLNCCKAWHDGKDLHVTKAFKNFLETGVIETTFSKEHVTALTIKRAKEFAKKLNCKLGRSILEAEEYRNKKLTVVPKYLYTTTSTAQIFGNAIQFGGNAHNLGEPLPVEEPPMWVGPMEEEDAAQG